VASATEAEREALQLEEPITEYCRLVGILYIYAYMYSIILYVASATEAERKALQLEEPITEYCRLVGIYIIMLHIFIPRTLRGSDCREDGGEFEHGLFCLRHVPCVCC
jgi:hypothetical protein